MLDGACCQHPFPDLLAGLGDLTFMLKQERPWPTDLDMQVNAIEQWPGNSAAIAVYQVG